MAHVQRSIANAAALQHPDDASMPLFDESYLERLAPWASSFLLHFSLVLVVAFIVYTVTGSVSTRPSSMPMIISLDKPDDLHSIPKGLDTHDGDLTDIRKLATQNRLRVQSDGNDLFGDLKSLRTTNGGMDDRAFTDIASIIGGNLSAGAGNGLSPGTGSGRIANWGLNDVHGSRGPPSIFDDRAPPARRMVYLLDHSGSTLDTFDYLRQEVKTATGNLAAFQYFSVIMFADDVTVLGPEALVQALPETKREVAGRLDLIRAEHENDGQLLPFQHGFEKAFAMRPEVIIFLTDGNFDHRLVDVVKKLNKDGKVKINTIAYIQIDPLAADDLKQIASDSGGRYKFVAEKDLHK